MDKLRVGVIGATGMVGQRFVSLLSKHPWFEISALAASERSAGRTYSEAVNGKWAMDGPIPPELENIRVLEASDIMGVSGRADLVFCAVNMEKKALRELEEAYAKAECPVVSNNSAHRSTPDVPMIIPELNAGHAHVITAQRKRLGTRKGFIAVKSNCSIQSYAPLLYPIDKRFKLRRAVVCTYQAASGAGKTLSGYPGLRDNVIPYIPGEEEKSEQEPRKIWGRLEGGVIVPVETPVFSARCIRVPVNDGHLAAVFANFEEKPDLNEIKTIWEQFMGAPQELELPSAPARFIHYFEEPGRPQPKLDAGIENGMAISAGGLREDAKHDISFIGLSHNTLRGAAGGAILLAELLCKMGYIK